MRIAITADPELPVPPKLYGGIERVIDLLVRGLLARGHEVTLFAHPDSSTKARLVGYAGRSSTSWLDTARNATRIALDQYACNFDIIHSFSRIAYLSPLLPLRIAKLMTYQRPITRRSITLAHRLAHGTLQFSAVSRRMIAPVRDVGSWHVVYNGVDLTTYRYVEAVESDAPFVFLGRIEHVKGTHLAVDVARRTGISLVIAGNVAPQHESYFAERIRPYIDGRLISYVGPVNDDQKNHLLGRARALLMPALWEEPFGIVMAEALACGTPVIGLARGAIPEIVEDGVTGFICSDANELALAANRIRKIDRGSCRARAERLFSGDAVVGGYLAAYERARVHISDPRE